MSSMLLTAGTFNVPLLPLVPFRHVVEQMHPIDLVLLMLTSERMRTRLQSLKQLKFNVLEIKVRSSGFSISFPSENYPVFKWNVTTKDIDQTDVHLHCREPLGPITIGGTVLQENWKINAADKIYTVVKGKAQQMKVLKVIAESLKKMFRCTITDLFLNLDVLSNQKAFFKWRLVREGNRLSLEGGTNEQRIHALDSVRLNEFLYMDAGFENGYQHEKMWTVEKLFILSKETPVNKTIMKRNACFTGISSRMDVNLEDLTEYIQQWRDGGYDKMELFSLSFQGVEFIHRQLLEAFPWSKFENGTASFWPGYNLHCVDLAFGHYMKRPDGKYLVVFCTTSNQMWFRSWNTLKPTNDCPRGTRKYYSRSMPGHVFFEPLKPEVFETEERALMDERHEF